MPGSPNRRREDTNMAKHDVVREYEGADGSALKLTFGALPVGYLKSNKDLLKKVGVKTGFEDLAEQLPVALESLKRGMRNDAPEDLDNLLIPDLTDALLASLEASGFMFAKVEAAKPGESDPAQA
jgi:hypothetical protein